MLNVLETRVPLNTGGNSRLWVLGRRRGTIGLPLFTNNSHEQNLMAAPFGIGEPRSKHSL